MPGEVVLHRRRQGALRRVLHEVDGILDGVARGEVGVDARSPQFVEVIETARCHRLAHAEQVGELHHFIVPAAHINVGNVFGIGPIHVRHLHDDVVLLAILLESRDLTSAEHGLKSPPNRFDIRADVGNLVAVDGDLEFGLVQPQVRIHVRQAGIFCGLGHQAVDVLLQLLKGRRGHDDELQGLVAALAERRQIDRKRVHAGEIAELRSQVTRDFLLAAGPLFPVFESQDHTPVRNGGKADDGVVAHHFRNLLVDFLDLPHVFRSVGDRRAFRSGHDAKNDSPVFERCEFLFQAKKQWHRQQDEHQPYADADAAFRQHGGQRTLIGNGHPPQNRFDRVVDPAVLDLMLEDQ